LKFPVLNYEPPNPREHRVVLKSGPVAYVVPDRELPLVTVSILVRTGAYLDPAGQEGLAAFTGALLVRGGTTSKTAEALDERLAFLAAQMGASIADDLGTVSLNLLSKDLPEGMALLREVLTQPRFQADKLELQRQQTLQALQQRNDDSSSIEGRELESLSYGPQFWAARQVTSRSINSLKREDLQAFHRRWFHPSNFIVSVSGDFDRAAMVQTLEKLFADWPFQGEVPPPIPTDLKPAGAGVYLVNKDVPQGRVSILLPGVMREDPDYPAILLMNDILGGGGFTSRIMNRVRSDEGLAYSAGSSFPGGTWYPSTFRAGFQSKSRTVAYATSIVIEEMKRMTTAPVTEEELQTAKRSFIESFPENFNTKSKVAGIFARGEIRDPELADVVVTVNEVRIGPDLQRATVFVTRLGRSDMAEKVPALRRAAPFLRGQLAKQLRLRVAPDISFVVDTSIDYAMHVDELLRAPDVARDLKRD
jgi:ribosome-binding factor A